MPLPGNLLLPDVRGGKPTPPLEQITLLGRASLLLEEGGLPARMAARMAALPGGERGWGEGQTAQQVHLHHPSKECGLPARKRPRWPLSQEAGGRAARGGAAGPVPGGSRHNTQHTSLRSAGFQPAWRPGWPPSQAGSPPHPLPGRLGPALVFPDERGLARPQLIVKRASSGGDGRRG